MSVRRLTMKEALGILRISKTGPFQPPKAKKGMTQHDLDREVERWKADELVAIHKRRRLETHPDRPGGSEEDFKLVEHAFEVVRDNLKLRIPAGKVAHCRVCKESRIPSDAAFCHGCGERYIGVEMDTCPVCLSDRQPVHAAFCHGCGYDYKKPDPFMDMLRSAGIPEPHLQKLKADGTLDKKRHLMAFSPELQQWIQAQKGLANLQSLRGGGWGGF